VFLTDRYVKGILTVCATHVSTGTLRDIADSTYTPADLKNGFPWSVAPLLLARVANIISQAQCLRAAVEHLGRSGAVQESVARKAQ